MSTALVSAGRRIQIVIARVDGVRNAIPLACVDRVLQAVEVTPLPGAPLSVLGVIQKGDSLLPVLCLRRRLGLPERELAPADHFLLVSTRRRLLALRIDEAEGVAECDPSSAVDLGSSSSSPEVVRLPDGLVLIQDLERFLSPDEERELTHAMNVRQ